MASISKPRKNQDGSVSVTAEIRIKRESQTIYKESKTFRESSERAAKRLADRWSTNREAELEDPATLRALIDPSFNLTTTNAELIQMYVDKIYHLRPWGKTKANTLELIQKSSFGQLVASETKSSDIFDYIQSLRANCAASTAGQYYVYIRGVFSVAEDLLGVPVNFGEVEKAQRLLSRLGVTGKSNCRERRPTVEEMTRLVSYCYERRKTMARQGRSTVNGKLTIPFDKVLVFAMFSSRRQSEITRLRRSLTDHDKRRVLVEKMKHPTEKESNDVWVNVPNEAWDVLMSMPIYPGHEDLYFPFVGKSFSSRFRDLLRGLGLWNFEKKDENLVFHDLRHEAASRLFELNGVDGQVWDVPRVSAVTGHRDWGMLQRYTQIYDLEPMDKWKDWEWTKKVCENF